MTPRTSIQPGQAQEIDELEAFLSGRLPDELLLKLRRFGSEFFSSPPSTYAPGGTVPIRPDYVIGPGDRIKVSLWGMVNSEWSLEVARDGTISIPTVGVVRVAGLAFGQLREAIGRQISRYYSNYQLSVTLDALRDMNVYVVGHVRQPGTYTLSSLSTLVNALVAAGGPAPQGSMRDLQVRRGGKLIARFDMYDFLLKGDKTRDVQLLPEDVIFVPPVGPQAAITGSVKVPAIYELKGNETLEDLIKLAGGLTSAGSRSRVQVKRVQNREYRTVFDGQLEGGDSDVTRMRLVDGDYVALFPVVDRADENIVRVDGPVGRPGVFAIKPRETRLSHLLRWAGGLLYHAAPEAELTRVRVTPNGPETQRIKVDLRAAEKGDPGADILLEPNDYLLVRSVPEWKLYRRVKLSGEVRYPGVYTVEDGERLSSVIARAGGFTPRAYLRGGVLTRESVRRAQKQQLQEMASLLERDLAVAGANDMSAAMTGADAQLVKLEVEQKRSVLEKIRSTMALGRVPTLFAPPEVLKGTPYDLALEDGDEIHIPPTPSTVQVLGAVINQSAFVFDKSMSWRDYIRMAGGYSPYANPDGIYILKVDGTAFRLKGGSSTGAPWLKEFGQRIQASLIEPGDAIVVPTKLSSYSGLRQTRDYLDILYKLAVTALSINEIGD